MCSPIDIRLYSCARRSASLRLALKAIAVLDEEAYPILDVACRLVSTKNLPNFLWFKIESAPDPTRKMEVGVNKSIDNAVSKRNLPIFKKI